MLKEIGGIGIDYDKFDIAERDNNAFNIPDKEAAEKVKAFAESKMSVGDSIGGVIECRGYRNDDWNWQSYI